MIRKLLILCALSSPVLAQTTIYTGTIKDLAGNAVTSGKVTFTLAPSTDSTIPGSGRFVPTTVSCTINADGSLSAQPSGACTVASNTSLSPTGTSYKICIQPYFAQPGSCFFDYAVTSTKDISTAAPTLNTGPVNYSGIPGPPLSFIGTWSSVVTYAKGVLVVYNNNSYISLVAGNLNHQPDTSPTFWSLVQSIPSIIPAPSTTQTITQPDAAHPLNVNYLNVTAGVTLPSLTNLTVTGSATLPGGYIKPTPAITQTVTQPQVSGLQSTLTANVFNSTYYVDGWCTTPGTYDDTCFNNAIISIANFGPTGAGNHKFGALIAGPHSYSLANSIVFPEGLDITLNGVDKNNLFGSILTSTVGNLVLVRDSADSLAIRHMNITGNATGQVGVWLGSHATGPFTITSAVAQTPIAGVSGNVFSQLNLSMAASSPALVPGQMITITGNSNTAYNSAFGYVQSVSGTTVIIQLITAIATNTVGTGGSLSGAAQPAFDTRLTDIWYQSLSVGIQCHNGTGVWMENSTWDDNVSYGLFFNFPGGDIKCAQVHGTDLEMFGQVTTIYASGDPANRMVSNHYDLKGVFEHTGRSPAGTTNTAMFFQNVADIHVEGLFQNNLLDDIQMYNVINANLGPIQTEGDGGSVLDMPTGNTNYNVNLHDVSSNNPSVNGAHPAVANIFGCNHCIFDNLSTSKIGTPLFGTSTANYGLAIDATSTTSVIGSFNFTGQSVSPTIISDTTATMGTVTIVGVPVAGQAACIKALGPPVIVGYCSGAVGAGGTCTCN